MDQLMVKRRLQFVLCNITCALSVIDLFLFWEQRQTALKTALGSFWQLLSINLYYTINQDIFTIKILKTLFTLLRLYSDEGGKEIIHNCEDLGDGGRRIFEGTFTASLERLKVSNPSMTEAIHSVTTTPIWLVSWVHQALPSCMVIRTIEFCSENSYRPMDRSSVIVGTNVNDIWFKSRWT